MTGTVRAKYKDLTQIFNARVTRTANALDAASRTLLTEIQFANPSGQVLPGMYGEVRCTRVALIRNNGTVHFQKIDLGRDNGADTEITGGLALGDTVIMNPTDEIREGSKVKAVE